MNKPCTRCNGSGITVQEAFTSSIDGTVYPRKENKCHCCDGRGHFEPLNVPDILAKIKGRKGLRSARPDYKHGARPYYVWRMARFHGGADVTMPMMASLDVMGDPFRDELDKLADAVAKRVFGTDLAAAYRWSNALGGNVTPPDGLPATAYSCGPEKIN